jgi:membrane associated rhomboid family serine protease
VYPRTTTTPPFGGFGGLTGPIPRDLLILFGVLFATFAIPHLGGEGLIRLLLLSRNVWSGYVWQIVTYPFIGIGGFFILISLIFLYMFARDVFYGLGRRHFWRLVLAAAAGSALVALLVDFLLRQAGWVNDAPFVLMQGQSLLWALFVAAFVTAYRGATIYMIFFPIEARWFLALEILFIFVSFLFSGEPGQPKDVPGLFGMYTAVGIGVGYIRSGGKGIRLRELRLRMERRLIQWKLDRGKRKFRVIPGDRNRGGNGEVRKGPWVH